MDWWFRSYKLNSMTNDIIFFKKGNFLMVFCSYLKHHSLVYANSFRFIHISLIQYKQNFQIISNYSKVLTYNVIWPKKLSNRKCWLIKGKYWIKWKILKAMSVIICLPLVQTIPSLLFAHLTPFPGKNSWNPYPSHWYTHRSSLEILIK